MATPVDAIWCLVLCADPTPGFGFFPYSKDESVFCTADQITVSLQGGTTPLCDPMKITHLEMHHPIPQPIVTNLLVRFPLLQSLKISNFANQITFDARLLPNLVELLIEEDTIEIGVVKAFVHLNDGLLSCFLPECVLVINDELPVTLRKLSFGGYKDWALNADSEIRFLRCTGRGHDFRFNGCRFVEEIVTTTTNVIMEACPTLKTLSTDGTWEVIGDLPELEVLLSPNVPDVAMPKLTHFGLHFGEPLIFQHFHTERDEFVEEMVLAARDRFETAGHVLVAPKCLIGGRETFTCAFMPTGVVIFDADADQPSFDFVVNAEPVQVIAQVIVGDIPERPADAPCAASAASCLVCYGELDDPSCIYACGIHPLCRYCVAKANQVSFRIVDGVIKPPVVIAPLHVCPSCRAPRGERRDVLQEPSVEMLDDESYAKRRRP